MSGVQSPHPKFRSAFDVAFNSVNPDPSALITAGRSREPGYSPAVMCSFLPSGDHSAQSVNDTGRPTSPVPSGLIVNSRVTPKPGADRPYTIRPLWIDGAAGRSARGIARTTKTSAAKVRTDATRITP